MKKRLVTLLLALGMLFAVAPPAVAAGPAVTVFEFANAGGVSASRTTKINNMISWKTNVTLGRCGRLFGDWGWNDCVSHFRVSLPSGRCVVFYVDVDYHGSTYAVHGPKDRAGYNLPWWIDNKSSAVRFGYVIGGVCTGPWT